jgi:hypothetical protein
MGDPMLVLATIIVLIGVLFGATLKYFVLVPATLFMACAILLAGVAHGESISLIAVSIAIAAICLQGGYFAGLFLCETVACRRSVRSARRAISGRAN